jgi:hypothetical protein
MAYAAITVVAAVPGGRGIGREGLLPFLEVKFMVLEGRPDGYEDTAL